MADGRTLTDDELFAAVRDLLDSGRAGGWPIDALATHAIRLRGMTRARVALDQLISFTDLAVKAQPRMNAQLVDVCVQMAASALELASRVEVER